MYLPIYYTKIVRSILRFALQSLLNKTRQYNLHSKNKIDMFAKCEIKFSSYILCCKPQDLNAFISHWIIVSYSLKCFNKKVIMR